VLRERRIDISIGMLANEARELNAAFYHAQSSDTPWTTLKLAVSIETAIANKRGTTSWLTGPQARAEVHRLRAGNDAIAVGIGTVLADDPQLTVREFDLPRTAPARVIFDRRLRTALSSKVVATVSQAPTMILTAKTGGTRAKQLTAAGVRLVEASDLRDGLRRLREAGIQSIQLEGGATIASTALAQKLVHRLVIFQSPVMLGANALYAFEGATPSVLRELELYPVLERRALGPDVMTTYKLAEIGVGERI
jgi:diaminohydroxyphosphoribosylaminopyrimidine deaminase / 5-amino-6-(5-phosphoribosylamino)uracil reductase